MKKTLLIVVSMLLLFVTTSTVKAQEWSTGLDVYSSYIWRGLKFGSGAAFQPCVEFSAGGFAIGAWGSVSTGTAEYVENSEAFEADLYMGYTFDLSENASLGITLTDYYFGGDWTDYAPNHYLEPSLALGVGDFSLTAAYMFLPESDDKDFGEDGDTYLEASYSFGVASLALGFGDGQYTDDGNFNMCNITLGTSKDLKITESFTLPVSGGVTLNPSTGGFFITVGATLF